MGEPIPSATDGGGAPPLAGLLALGMVVGTINGLGRVAMPLYAAAVGAQPWQVGIVGGLGYAGILLLALPTGAWIDRHGSRAMFQRGVAGAALLYLLLPFVHSAWPLILAAGMLGLLLPMRTIPVHTEFLALLPQLSPSRAGWNRAANTVGLFFVGPAVSAALIAAAGFVPVFALASASLALALMLARRVLTHAPADDGDDPPLLSRIAAQLSLVRRHAEARRTMGIDFLVQMAIAYFVVFALILAVRRYGMSLQAAAGLVTVQGVVYLAVLFFGAHVVQRWRDETSYGLAFALLLAQSLLCGWGGHAATLWVGAALMGGAMGLQGLTSTQRFAELMREFGRGRIGGLTSLAPTAGGVIGAMGGGVVSQRLGTEAGFELLALAFAVMLALELQRRRRPAPPPAAP